MKADNLFVKGISLLTIESCEINKKVNQHGTAKLTGMIEDNYESACLSLAVNQTYLEIWASDDSRNSECLFVGYIDDMEINSDDVKSVTISLATGTKLMDMVTRTRTFQNAGMTYKQVLRSNEAFNIDINAGSIYLESGDGTIGDLVVQYKETDWEFGKRIASMNHTFLRPAFNVSGCKYFYGLKEGQTAKAKPSSFFNYKIKKRNTEYQKTKKTGEFTLEAQDAYSYTFSSRELFELGDAISLSSGKVFVYKVRSNYEGQELINTYELRTANGFKVSKKYNNKLIGASLAGSITSASKDKVQLLADVDNGYSDHGSKEFLYSTVYSSPDGTGWYCMPEPGDCIRLYFPSEREKDAYAISSVHLDVSDSSSNGAASQSSFPAPRTDPNYKSFKNPAGKEIIFAPTSLSIINPDVGSIILDDNSGITITSDKSIRFKAIDFVEMHSTTSSLEMNAMTDLTMEQGEDVKFSLNENIYLKGAQLKLQE